MSENDSSSFLVGFMTGAAIGLAIGFLYAPRPGEETRRLLLEKAELVKEKANEIAEKVKETTARIKGGEDEAAETKE